MRAPPIATLDKLKIWIDESLRSLKLTTNDVELALGREAAKAFEFDGVGLLSLFLCNIADWRTAKETRKIIDGLNSLLDAQGQSEARRGLSAQYAKTLKEKPPPPSQDEKKALARALRDATTFRDLGVETLVRSRVEGSPDRARDIANFEVYRLARIATRLDDVDDPLEAELLSLLANWVQAAGRGEPEVLDRAIHDLAQASADFNEHSVIMHVAATNPKVFFKLGCAALDLLFTVGRLGELTTPESEWMGEMQETDWSSETDQVGVADEAEFAKLLALYEACVWSDE